MTLPAARLTDLHVCPASDGPKPHVGGPIQSPGLPTLLIGNLVASRVADFCVCVGPLDVISKGASTVLWGGLPAARLTDSAVHGGLVALGCFTVLIGGPAFALPPCFTLSGSPTFQNKVVRDLYLLSTTPTGAALLARLAAANQPITFQEWGGTNGFCRPADAAAAQAGTPTGSIIQYNPDYRSNAYDSAGNLLPQPPQVILGHEMVHALNNSEGTHHYGEDPSAPASEPHIDREESSAIGTGSHNGDPVNENGIRNDLGMGRRDNHFGTGGPQAGEPAPLDLRPGGY